MCEFDALCITTNNSEMLQREVWQVSVQSSQHIQHCHIVTRPVVPAVLTCNEILASLLSTDCWFFALVVLILSAV